MRSGAPSSSLGLEGLLPAAKYGRPPSAKRRRFRYYLGKPLALAELLARLEVTAALHPEFVACRVEVKLRREFPSRDWLGELRARDRLASGTALPFKYHTSSMQVCAADRLGKFIARSASGTCLCRADSFSRTKDCTRQLGPKRFLRESKYL